MISTNEISRISGTTVYTNDGDKIGSAGQVYLDDATGQPQWVTVNTGFFGTSESFVPLSEATLSDDRLVVPFEKKMVKDAPRLGDNGHLSPTDEDELYRYYGLSGTGTVGTDRDLADDTLTRGEYASRGAGHDTSGPDTDDAMTRSEERLNVGTESQETGRARLRKYVTTEHQTVDVPVTKEEVRLEREPVTAENAGRAKSGPAISEEEHEVTLHEERPVVTTEAVPVERVRMEKDTVTDTETVEGDVRKEHIDLDEAESARTRSER